MQVRVGEDHKPWARLQRVKQINANWYFITREKTQEGPFGSLAEAEAELEQYIANMKRRANEINLSSSDILVRNHSHTLNSISNSQRAGYN